jgi:hypothetical protein
MLDPESAAALYPPGRDVATRLRVLADGYGLGERDRAELPRVVEQATEICRAFVARRVAEGVPRYTRMLVERGGRQRWDRIESWLVTHRHMFQDALPR